MEMTEQYIIASDQELVEMTLDKGDDAAFECLVNRYLDAIRQLYTQRARGTSVDVDDLLQETMVKVFLHLDRYDSKYTFGQWIFTIARNTFVDHMRRKRDDISIDAAGSESFNVAPISLHPNPEESIIRSQQRHQLQRCMDGLPDDYRALIELRFLKEYSYEEIAAELKMPLGTVKTRIHRARERLIRNITKNTDLE